MLVLKTANSQKSIGFDTSRWKLQIPGPVYISDFLKFKDKHFNLDNEGNFNLYLDGTEKGFTKTAKTPRVELAQNYRWLIHEHKELEATIKAEVSEANLPLTILQIHGGIVHSVEKKPLLRVVIKNNELWAFVKIDTSAIDTKKKLIKKNVLNTAVKYRIVVNKGILKLYVDNELSLEEDVSFWIYSNYFKIGAYCRENYGLYKVTLFDIKEVNH